MHHQSNDDFIHLLPCRSMYYIVKNARKGIPLLDGLRLVKKVPDGATVVARVVDSFVYEHKTYDLDVWGVSTIYFRNISVTVSSIHLVRALFVACMFLSHIREESVFCSRMNAERLFSDQLGETRYTAYRTKRDYILVEQVKPRTS